LGPGFLEKVYERALLVELRMRGIKALGQAPIELLYKGESIGDYFADILVEDSRNCRTEMRGLVCKRTYRCLNNLKATKRQLALIFNLRSFASICG
jgi:GxxExxY protein